MILLDAALMFLALLFIVWFGWVGKNFADREDWKAFHLIFKIAAVTLVLSAFIILFSHIQPFKDWLVPARCVGFISFLGLLIGFMLKIPWHVKEACE